MNKRQVIILWVIAIVLGAAVTAVKLSQNKATKVTTARKAGEALFQSFPAESARTIDIQSADTAVSLSKKDGKWVVAQRANYPANSTYVNDLIRTLGDLKITQALEAGPSFAPRFGMDETSEKPAEHGLIATIKDEAGKEIAKIALGKNIENGNASAQMPGMGASSVGRYVRNYGDSSGFYAVAEMFPAVSADAKRWLSDSFFSPEKIKTISTTQPGKTDIAWKLTRESDEAEFKLENAATGEVLDTTASAALKSLFSYARFQDVVPPDQIADRAVADDKRIIKIDTVEGFNYTLTISATRPGKEPQTPPASDPNAEPAATDNYLLTVDVSAELPTERKKEEGEKPEDAKAKDEAFAERQKALTEKLAKENALSGITFEVGKSLVEPLLKDRKTLTTKAAPPQEGASAGGIQQMPGGMIATPPTSLAPPSIEAVTPAISVPGSDEDEDDSADLEDDDDSGDEGMIDNSGDDDSGDEDGE